MRFIFGVFIVLHGLVHLLYFGQSARYFELKPGMVWPDGSWAFSRLLGDEAARNLASISLILAAMGAAAFSSVVYILFWNGRMQNLDGQGGIGLLIDIAILLAVLILRWPQLGF
jgi:hypothetical protein